MLIKVLAWELIGLCGSLISHLMSTFHDNTIANGGYCSPNLHDGTWKCKGSLWVLMSVKKSKKKKKEKEFPAPPEIVEFFFSKRKIAKLCLLHAFLTRHSSYSATVPK